MMRRQLLRRIASCENARAAIRGVFGRPLHRVGAARLGATTLSSRAVSTQSTSGPSRNLWFWIFPSVTFGLGTWQVFRYREKQEMIRFRQSRCQAEPVVMPESLPGSSREVIENWAYRPVKITGRFHHQTEFHVYPRHINGEAGFHVVTPFELKSGKVILVNRGWIPRVKRDPATRAEGQVEGEVTINCLVRTGDQPGRFTPENDLGNNNWFWIDVDTISKLVGCEPFLVDVRDDSTPECGVPLGGQTKIDLPNNHLSYIVTWYTMCGCSAVMAMRFGKGRKSPVDMHDMERLLKIRKAMAERSRTKGQ